MLKYFLNFIQKFGIEAAHRYYGSYYAVVVDNNDPDRKGRVKVTTAIYGGTRDYWITPISNYGGNTSHNLPSVGDMVILTFIAGDARYPLYIGSVGQDYKALQNLTNYVDTILVATPKGYKASIDDTDGKVLLEAKSLEVATDTVDLGNGVRTKAACSDLVDTDLSNLKIVLTAVQVAFSSYAPVTPSEQALKASVMAAFTPLNIVADTGSNTVKISK